MERGQVAAVAASAHGAAVMLTGVELTASDVRASDTERLTAAEENMLSEAAGETK